MSAFEQIKENPNCSLNMEQSPDVELGSMGKLVCELQTGLVLSGFLKPGQVDGVFGKNTRAATENFQNWQEFEYGESTGLNEHTKNFLIELGRRALDSQENLNQDTLSSLKVPTQTASFEMLSLARIKKFLTPNRVVDLSSSPDSLFSEKLAAYQQQLKEHVPNIETNGVLDSKTMKVLGDIIAFRNGVSPTEILSSDINSLNLSSEVRTESEGLIRMGFDPGIFQYDPESGLIRTKDPKTKKHLLINKYYIVSSSNGLLCQNREGCTSFVGAKIAAMAALNQFAKSYIESTGPNERVILTGFSELKGHDGVEHKNGTARDIQMTLGMLKYFSESDRFEYLPYSELEKQETPQFVARFHDKILNIEFRWESSTAPLNLGTALALEGILAGVRNGAFKNLEVVSPMTLKYQAGSEERIWNLPKITDPETKREIWARPGHLHSAISTNMNLSRVAPYSRIK